MRETVGLELASTVTLALQANRLTKCASHFLRKVIAELVVITMRNDDKGYFSKTKKCTVK